MTTGTGDSTRATGGGVSEGRPADQKPAGRLLASRARLDALRSAGRLAVAIDTAAALCAVHKEVIEAGGHAQGPDWNRCRILYRDTALLARILEAACQAPIEAETPDREEALAVLACRMLADAGAAFRYARRSVAVYEQWCGGMLDRVSSIETAERIAGLLGDPKTDGGAA